MKTLIVWLLAAFFAIVALGIATGTALATDTCVAGDVQIQPIPSPSPQICVGGEGPATATPTPRPTQDVGQPAVSGQSPWLICPPYTDRAETLPNGRVRCAVSSGETLTYDPQTDRWSKVSVPDTAMGDDDRWAETHDVVGLSNIIGAVLVFGALFLLISLFTKEK